jgi:pimeloyl-ACP methyl ester carboxylesterase
MAAVGERSRTIAPDRPGWDGTSGAVGVEGNARAIVGLLDRQGVTRATVAGHSFGGAVACWIAAHAPERVGALVLAAPSANLASLYSFDRWLAAPVLGAAAAATMLGAGGLILSSGRARAQVAAKLRVQDGYLREAGRSMRSPRAWRAFVVEQRALLQELPQLERGLGQIAAPTTILIGSEDRVVPPRSAELLRRQIPGAQLQVLTGAGHLLPLFQPERLSEVILGPSQDASRRER